MTRVPAPSFIAFCVALLGAATPSFAQVPATNATSIVVDRFAPQPFHRGNVVNVLASDVHDHLQLDMGVVASFVDRPLRLVPVSESSGARSSIIDHQMRLDVAASLGLFNVAELMVAMPFVANQVGGQLDATGSTGISGTAAGDLRLIPKVRLLDGSRTGGFGIALAAPIYVPTGDEASFNSDGALRGGGLVIVDWRLLRRVLVTANGGYEFRKNQSVLNYRSDDVIVWGVGAEVATGLSTLSIIGNVFGAIPTVRDLDPTNFARTVTSRSAGPIEALVGARMTILGALSATVAGSTGLNDNVGAPSYRLLAALSYALPGNSTPEASPATYVSDAPPMAPVEPPREPDPEPVLVASLATVPPSPAESASESESESAVAKLEEDNIVIRENVRFAAGKDVLAPGSYPILDGVVAVLDAHPEIARLRIEGHTDDQGSAVANRLLSIRRATAVKMYLVGHGIARDRLDVTGHGASRPLVTNDSKANREKNRRVEFHVEARRK